MSAVSAYIVCASQHEAQTIATALVEEGLAACVNILGPVSSIYRWQGKVGRADEVAMIAKTTLAAADALIIRVTELHSYDVPAITVWPILKLPAEYGDWIEENVRETR